MLDKENFFGKTDGDDVIIYLLTKNTIQEIAKSNFDTELTLDDLWEIHYCLYRHTGEGDVDDAINIAIYDAIDYVLRNKKKKN